MVAINMRSKKRVAGHPKVSVIMSVYNDEKYVSKSVDSILRQTFKDFEFIIVNDASTDKTRAILDRINDKRVVIINNPKRSGPAQARNVALKKAKGNYIAIMDSDDISAPQRFVKQVEYMKKNPKVGIVGASQENIDKNGKKIISQKRPTEIAIVRWAMFFGDCRVSHSTVMMRKDVIKTLRGYLMSARAGEDYDLWTRALFITNIANMPDVLSRKRLLKNSLTYSNPKEELRVVINSMRHAITRLLKKKVDKKTVAYLFLLERNILLKKPWKKGFDKRLAMYRALLGNIIPLYDPSQIKAVAELIRKLYDAYLGSFLISPFEKRQITLHAFKRLFALCKQAKKAKMPQKDIASLLRL